MDCPTNPDKEHLPSFINGGYCPGCGQFNEETFRGNWHAIYFLVFSFIRRFNLRDFQACDQDPVLSMIGAEIWLYNISRLMRRDIPADLSKALNDEQTRDHLLPKCNTHSLSQFLEIPNQTVRRKVQKLIDMGWVTKGPKGELAISAKCEEFFNAEFNLETMRDFVSTARATFAMLGLEGPVATANVGKDKPGP